VIRDQGVLYTWSGVDEHSKKNLFRKDGYALLLNKQELDKSGLKNKQEVEFKINSSFRSDKIKSRIIILRITSKQFKKLYNINYGDNHSYITDKYEYDLLLHKALKYTKIDT